jgi:hypothetical protein
LIKAGLESFHVPADGRKTFMDAFGKKDIRHRSQIQLHKLQRMCFPLLLTVPLRLAIVAAQLAEMAGALPGLWLCCCAATKRWAVYRQFSAQPAF